MEVRKHAFPSGQTFFSSSCSHTANPHSVTPGWCLLSVEHGSALSRDALSLPVSPGYLCPSLYVVLHSGLCPRAFPTRLDPSQCGQPVSGHRMNSHACLLRALTGQGQVSCRVTWGHGSKLTCPGWILADVCLTLPIGVKI